MSCRPLRLSISSAHKKTKTKHKTTTGPFYAIRRLWKERLEKGQRVLMGESWEKGRPGTALGGAKGKHPACHSPPLSPASRSHRGLCPGCEESRPGGGLCSCLRLPWCTTTTVAQTRIYSLELRSPKNVLAGLPSTCSSKEMLPQCSQLLRLPACLGSGPLTPPTKPAAGHLPLASLSRSCPSPYPCRLSLTRPPVITLGPGG